MNLIDKIDELQLFYGKPLIFKDICLIYSPTLGDIAQIGVEKFYQYIGILTITKEKMKMEENIPEIVYLMLSSLSNEDFRRELNNAFMFFIKEPITVIPEIQILQIGELSEKRFLNQENFPLFQHYIRTICLLDLNDLFESNDINEHTRRIKEKIRKGQQKVAEIKRKGGNEDGLDLIDLISSFLLRSSTVDINTIWDMSYYMFQTQFKRMQMAEEYDVNLRSALAGAKIPKDKMKYWIRKIHKE